MSAKRYIADRPPSRVPLAGSNREWPHYITDMGARQCVAGEEKGVSKSASESYLKELADRTFLSL